jgi:hypothetical protein
MSETGAVLVTERSVRCVVRAKATGPAFRSKYTEEASLGLMRRRQERRVFDGSRTWDV